MPERSLNSTLRTSLLNNDAFAYAHLVKFEKPSLTSQVEGAIAGKATDYAYITDAAQDIVYNDGSTDSEGNANGSQTYRANRLVSVGTVSETTEARASNMALKLYATTLGTTVEDSLNISSGSLAGTVSFSDEGFREGDKVLLTGGGSNNGKYVIINAFSNAGKTLAVTPVDTTLSTESSATYTLSLASEEITALLLNKSNTGYASFLNREVYVYKAHLSAEDNSIIGEPYLLFKGIVSNGSIQEKPDSNSTVTWNLTSHWGDFVQVRGRITSDAFHRALDPTGRPDRDGLIRPEYANDLGFLHSEKAVNFISTYQVKETRYRKQTKSGFLGFNKKISLIPYDVEVDREVDLRFNLQAKYLPVVYGVQRVDSIPFFVDTLVNDPKQVYVGYAISEGEIGGIYDIYIDDTPSICIDQNDYDARSSQTTEQTIDVLCKGRADQGDTLSGASYFSGTFNTGLASTVPGLNDWEIRDAGLLGASLTALSGVDFSLLTGTGAQTSGTGITHEKGHSFVTPIDTSLTFHAGKPFQRANSVLAQTASSNSFKIQNDYYDNEADYWGANHRLLDTAYVVSKYTISEGETQIPELDFVVRGKLIDCYNYDYSYAPNLENDSSHDESLFKLLDTVTLHNTTTDAQIGSSVQIIDKWSFQDETGTTQYRFRFSENPSLGSVKRFYMKNTSGDRWYFETYDYSPSSGTVSETLDTAISTASDNTTSGVDLALSSPTLAAQAAFRFGNSLNLTDGQFDEWYNSEFDYVEDIANNAIQAVGQANSSTFNATTAIPANSIALASSASSTDDIYNGYKVRLTRFDSNGVPYIQERIITDYLGSEKVAIVDSKWDAGKTPIQGDTYEILSVGDKRVSINPAMQLLDYLISPRYGKGLTLAEDISLESFQDTGRLCDTRSNVFMQAYSNAITDGVDVGDVFKYVTSSGKTVFQGKVKNLTYHSGPNSTEVEFEEVVGKIARKWEDWKTFESGDLYWYEGRLYVASANGKISTPTSNNTQGTTTLTKVSGTGTVTSWQFNTISANFDGNPIVKAYDSATDRFKKTGYSLYDSDDVKYWRYVGWDAQEQRYVTRHQTNFVIDTAKPVFDNINGMLNHFNGILRYANGRYELDVESSVGVLSEAQYIDSDDIIGEIKITDSGQKGVYNSVSAAIPDPQNRFDNRTVTFFNSQYLKEDRGVPKQGNFNLPGVTNYFNARINVKQFLDQSRYSLSINFTMMPKGTLLLAGSLVSITYPRFGWTNKLFRISNLNFTSECLAQVTAEEHNDDAYIISGFNKEYYNKYEPAPIITPTPVAPSNLVATDDERGGITLTWNNGSNFNPSTYVTEIWRNSTNDRSSATLLGVTKGTTFLDSVTTEGAVTRYYWIRHSVSVLSQLSSQAAPREIFSPWYPLSATAGESGTSLALLDGINITLSRPVVALASDTEGTVGDFGGSGTDITVTQGTTRFEYDGSASPAANTFSVTATSPNSVVTFDATPTTVNDGSGNPTIRRYDDITAMSAIAGAVVFTVTVNFGNSLSTDFTITQSLSKVSQGENGVDSRTVNLTVSDQSIEYSSAGSNPSPNSVTITATALNTSQTPYYEFFIGGSSVQNTVASTYAYNAPTNYTSLPKIVEVHLREGSSTGTVLARDQITIFGVKPGQSAISAVLSNESHVLFEDESGTVDFTGSGTSIEVFEGNTQLSYDGTASPANGTFKVTAVGTNITLETSGSPSTSGDARVYADHTAISADTGSVAYTITATRADGTTETLTRTQSLTKVQEGAAARNVTLAVTDQSISYDTNGANPDPDAVTFTATARNMQDTAYYTFFVNGSEVQASSTTATYAYTVPTAFTSLPVQVRVDVREGASTGTVVAQDFVTVIGTKPGENAITIILTNESHSLPTTTAGVVTYTGSGTDIQVYEGNTQLQVDDSPTYDAGTFRVSASGSNITAGDRLTNPDIYTVSFDKHGSMTANNASVTYTIDVVKADGTTATFTRVQSLSKANQGATGAPGVKTALVYAYQRSASALTSDAGDVDVNLDTGVITTATLANGWSKTIPSGSDPLYVIAASAAGTGSSDTIEANEWSAPVILSQDGTDGDPGDDGLNTATVFIYKRTTTNTAPTTLPAGNTTYTFSTGAAVFTTDNGWSRDIPSTGGEYLWVSQATAASTTATDIIEANDWSDPPALLAQDGATGDTGPRTASGFLYYQNSSSTAPSAPTASSYDFSTGQFGTITADWDEDAPTFAAGNANKYWYVRFTVEEETFGGSQTVTIGSVIQGIGFSGLVTFADGTSVSDGNNSLSFGESGTTKIDGGNITTGKVSAQHIDVAGVITAGSILTDQATIGNDIKIGSGESVFIADSNGIYLGNETFTNAEFRVTPAGALTATGVTVTGDITATSLTLDSGVSIGATNLPIDIYASVDSTTVNKDPYFANRDGDYWFSNSGGSSSIDADSEFSFKTDGTGLPTGRSTYLQAVSNDDFNDTFFSESFDLESGKAYRITVWVQQPSGAKKNYLLVGFRDSNGANINNSSSPVSDGQNWPYGIGTYHYYGIANSAFPTSWTKYEVVFGGNSSIQPPTNAVQFFVGALTLRDVAGSTTTINWAQYHVEEIDSAATNATVTSIGGVTITGSKLYQGTGTFGNDNTGFYLDSNGRFSLRDKLSFDPTGDQTTLNIEGSLVAERVTAGTGGNAITMNGAAPGAGQVVRRLYTGADSGPNLFYVDSAGSVHAQDIYLYDDDENLVFSSKEGFQSIALTQIAQSTEGVKVTEFSEGHDGADHETEIAFSASTTPVVRVIKNVGNWVGYGTATTEAGAQQAAINNVVSTFDLMIRYGSSTGVTSTTGTGLTPSNVTGGWYRYTRTTGSSPSASQYRVQAITTFFISGAGEPGIPDQYFAEARVVLNAGAVNAAGQIVLSESATEFSASTVYFATFMRETDSTAFSSSIRVSPSDPRTFAIEDPTVDGGFTVDGGASQTVGAADITSVTINTSGGLTGGGSVLSGAASFNLSLDSSIATTTYVDTAVANLVDSAPGTLDTLNELAAALGDDANFSTTVTNSIATKWTQDNTKISNWDTAYGWGNHADGGYLTGNESITLSGDASGTGSTSITVTLADTLSPATATELSSTDNLNDFGSGQAGFYYQTANADTPDNNYPSGHAGSLIVQKSAGNATQLYQTYQSDAPRLYFRSAYNTGYGTWQRVFADNYHPNADKLTTARTITLGGDLSGSASFDGSANITISAAVANDSHTHDGRYYTESEADSRFVNSAGGKVFTSNNASGNSVEMYFAAEGDASPRWRHIYGGSGTGFGAGVGGYGIYYDGSQDYSAIFRPNGDVDFRQGSIQILGTTVIDSSRNLTNIGTISSGAITSTGASRFDQISLEPSSGSGTGGGRLLDVIYSGTDRLITLSADRSSGALTIGYGAESSTTTGQEFLSTFDNFSGTRSAVQFRNDRIDFWGTSANVQTTVGSQLTTMTNRISLHTDNGDISADGTIYSGAITSSGRAQVDYVQTNSGIFHRVYQSSWAAGAQTHDVFYGGWTGSTSDYIYLKTAGNSTAGHGQLIVADNALFYGRTNAETGGIVDSSTAPFEGSVVAMKVDTNGKMTLGRDGAIPQINLIYDDHASGAGWDTSIHIGRSNDLPGGAGAFPTSTPSGAYGIQFQANSDGVFYGMEEYSTGQYRPYISWGDDNSDTPMRWCFNGSGKMVLDYAGNLTAAGNVTAYSDLRLKENIEIISGALEKVQQIRGVTFTRNDHKDTEKRHAGVIAQEVEKVLPEVVDYNEEEDVKTVSYGNMVGLLIEAIKEQQEQIEELKVLIKEMKNGNY